MQAFFKICLYIKMINVYSIYRIYLSLSIYIYIYHKKICMYLRERIQTFAFLHIETGGTAYLDLL